MMDKNDFDFSLVGICANRANGDKFLQLGMVVGMGETFSKTTANKVATPPCGRCALINMASTSTQKSHAPALLEGTSMHDTCFHRFSNVKNPFLISF